MELPIQIPRFITQIDQDHVAKSVVERIPEWGMENILLNDGRVVRVVRGEDYYYETVWASLNEWETHAPPSLMERHPI